jgi:molybdenum cofactor synthesis domain-containing protein
VSHRFEIVSVNVSEAAGTAKRPVPGAAIGPQGLVGDAHAGPGIRQVSLLALESAGRFTAETGRAVAPGEFAENLTTRGLDLTAVAPLDRFRIGEAELEVTQIGKSCHGSTCAIFRDVGRCVMPREGLFCRVLRGGPVRPGDAGTYDPRPLKIRILTLSDRAFRGEYEDRSGPKAREAIEAGLRPRRWHLAVDAQILPDDADRLRRAIREAREAGVDVLVTTGGTGVGPRDIAPETLAAACDRLIPGIMEAIRVKFGAENPRALLSRGIAGVAGTMLVYALPGSARAVEEYLGEILRTLEHLLMMIHAVDVHGAPAPPAGGAGGGPS